MKQRRHFETEEEYKEYLKQPKRFFSYDGDGNFELHLTAEEAQICAQKALDYCAEESADDGWPDFTDEICWGELKGEVREISRRTREEQTFDEEGCDELGTYWPDWWGWIADYKLQSFE